MDNRPRYRVPDELRETLLDFTIAYLLERPPNLIDFGIQFFQRMKGEREQGGSSAAGSGRGSQQLNGRSNEIDDNEGHRQHRRQHQSRRSNVGGGGGPGPAHYVQRGFPVATPEGSHRPPQQVPVLSPEDFVGVTQTATQIVEEAMLEASAVLQETEQQPRSD